jgi:tRNA G18 (ribose-2'-O)-methylase SpoU
MNRKLKLEELNRPQLDEYKKAEKLPLAVVLDNVRSMHNVGAVFRSADAFLVKEILLAGFTPKPPHRDIRKVAIGATESVEWSYHDSTELAIKELRKKGYTLVAIEQTERSIDLKEFHFSKDKKWAIVLGNEVDGVSQNIIDQVDESVEIEQFGTKHSLNVSVCTGIVLWKANSDLLND